MSENGDASGFDRSDFREKYRLKSMVDMDDTVSPDQWLSHDQSNHGYRERSRSGHRRTKLDMAWADFSDSTTLHGLRFIAMSDAFVIRRLLWFLLVLVCLGVMTFQIVDRILYYYDNPVNVNVKVNYNESLYFPAVTLCNQNTFKATAATEKGWYRLIESMYKHPHHGFNVSELDMYNATTLPMGDLFRLTGHDKGDLIVRCTWGDRPCGPHNFTAVLTDHGLCYTFNSDTDPENMLLASSSGSDAGLRLLLNVEQYEYMLGPSSAAGVKILTHGQHDFPRVRELGISVPTGTHAFVGLQVIALANLPPPHGQCNEKELHYFDHYSFDSCRLECMLSYVEALCNCRDFYMPSVHGLPKVCTLQQYFTCFLVAKEEYLLSIRTGREVCDCPTSCSSLVYNPILSYATTSRHSVDNILDHTLTAYLTEKLTRAREVTHRMEKDKFNDFHNIVIAVNGTLRAVKVLFYKDTKRKLSDQMENVKDVSGRILQAWHEKNFAYRYQEYHVRKNFMRGRDAMEERTLNLLCIGFHEFVFMTEAYLKDLVSASLNSTESRTLLYTIAQNRINDRTETARRALANYTALYDAYKTGIPLFRYKFLNVKRVHNEMITPRLLLNDSLHHNPYARKYSPRMKEDIEHIIENLQDYLDLLDEVASTTYLNTTKMAAVSTHFIGACEDFYHSKSVFYYESIDRPLRIILGRRERFKKAKMAFLATVQDIKDNIIQLEYSLATMSNDIRVLSGLVEHAMRYFWDKSIHKLDISKMAEAEAVHAASLSLKTFVQEVRSRGQTIYDGWTDLVPKGKSIWKPILKDDDMTEYYQYQGMLEFLANYTEISLELERNYTDYRNADDIRFIVGLTAALFHDAMADLQNHVASFVLSTVVDHSVIKDNYLELDIFYREMNYEEIRQQKAYDVFSLLCDIGGSMGLFVGASVMTMFELIDLFLNLSAERLFRTRQR